MEENIIVLNQVSKTYAVGSERVRALQEVSLRIRSGEFALIVGRSGSGKSTLLNLMAGLEKPSRGQIRVAGKQIERMNESQLVSFRLKNVGFVFQSFNLFAAHDALDNVSMPLVYQGIGRAERTRRARQMLEAVGLKTHLRHKPSQMSGGQQQRVGIARALVTRPKILFADEPTGNLDYNTSREILSLIRSICRERGATLIMVTHDPELARYADHVVRLLDGRVVEESVSPAPASPGGPEEGYPLPAAGRGPSE